MYYIYPAFYIYYIHYLFIYPQFLHLLYRLALQPYCGIGEYFIYHLPCWKIREVEPRWFESRPCWFEPW